MLWGNKYIKRNGKCLIFHNWIESNITYVNDILSNEGTISEVYILNKLNNKRNWVSEIYSIKQSIPKTWLNILKQDISVKSQVKTTLTEGPLASIKHMSDKEINIQFIKHNFQKPYVHNFWKRYFDIETNWQQLYHFLNYILIDNRVKQVRFKLIHIKIE